MDGVTIMLLLLGVALAIAVVAGVLAARAVDRRIAAMPYAGVSAFEGLADALDKRHLGTEADGELRGGFAPVDTGT